MWRARERDVDASAHNGVMTQPTPYGGRPQTPAPGVEAPEKRIARFRPHGRVLFWPAVLLIAVAGACGYLLGNLPAGYQDWMLLAGAGALVLLLVVLPYLAWLAHVYIITTQRIIERRGLFVPQRRELAHVRGYTVQLRRSILQRMWGAGTLVLAGGVEEPMTLKNVPSAALVHETLVDQIEVSQILAHRDAQPLPTGPIAT